MAYDKLTNLVYAIGNTDKGGYWVDKASTLTGFNTQASQVGIILQTTDGSEQVGGGVAYDENVQYPIQVVAEPTGKYIFVTSIASSNPQLVKSIPTGSFPNVLGSNVRPYGDEFFVVVERYVVDVIDSTTTSGVDLTVTQDWHSTFKVNGGESAFVEGMTLAGNGDTLIIVGSTPGSGAAFGQNIGTDMDGFLMRIDPETGDLFPNQISQKRLDSSNEQDDWITAICNDRFDNDSFYVVGATKGYIRELPAAGQPPEGTIHSFIAKISADSLNPEWIKHFTMTTAPGAGVAKASAYACTVTTEGESNLVYMAGVVELSLIHI